MVQGGLQMHGLGFRIGAVEGAHGADHDFAGENTGDQADADLPVESEGRNCRLDKVAQAANDAIGEFRRGDGAARRVHYRQVRQYPQRKRDAENDRSCLAQKNPCAIHQAHRERAQRGHSILRQF